MRTIPKTLRLLIVSLSVLSSISACSDPAGDVPTESGSPPISRDRTERLAADVASRRASIARIEAAGHDDLILEEVKKLFRSADDSDRVPLSGWVLRKSSLGAYMALHKPLKDRGETPFGIDFGCEGHPVIQISTYARLLREHGIDLLVVPVPHRLQVYGDLLPGIEPQGDFPGAGATYARLLLALAQEGVEVVDLLPSFLAARFDDPGEMDEHVFLADDPHWTPRGMALAAELVAARVRAFAWYEQGPERAGEHFEVTREQGLHPSPERAPAATDRTTVWYQKVLRQDGRPVTHKARKSPILIIGDSFVAYYKDEASDLCRNLYARLGQGLDSISSSGDEGSTTWKAIQRRGDELAGKRLVVWVFRFSYLCYPRLEVVSPFE